MSTTKTIKTLNALKKYLTDCINNSKYDEIIYDPPMCSNMAKISCNLFDFINELNDESYKNAMPKITFKNIEFIGAMFNNSNLNEWILDKIEFENIGPIAFHGIFKYNYKFSTDAIKDFFQKHRDKDITIYGTSDAFLNEYILPKKFNDMAMLYLTLDFMRFKVYPKFDITYEMLISPKFSKDITETDMFNIIKHGVIM